MPKTKEQKEAAVKILTDKLRSGRGVVFATFTNVPMEGTERLRATCRKQGIYYTVPKKTLTDIALKEAGIEAPVSDFEGNLSMAVGDDEVAPAQTLAAFAKEFETFKIVGGLLENKFIDHNQVIALSKLPSKHELLGTLVATLQAPIAGFARVLNGNIVGLVRALNAIKEQKA